MIRFKRTAALFAFASAACAAPMSAQTDSLLSHTAAPWVPRRPYSPTVDRSCASRRAEQCMGARSRRGRFTREANRWARAVPLPRTFVRSSGIAGTSARRALTPRATTDRVRAGRQRSREPERLECPNDFSRMGCRRLWRAGSHLVLHAALQRRRGQPATGGEDARTGHVPRCPQRAERQGP